ncbi:MAG: flagellar export protein FliJ [Gemmataceae bacterium]
MKRFHFRMERVLSLKEQREKLAEMRQHQARARLEEAHTECTRIEGEMQRVAADAAARLRESAILGTWQAHYEQAALLGEMLTAAQRRTTEAEARLQEANRLRIQASLEVEALRGLRTREWQNYRKEAARQQQNNLDELGLQRWLAKRLERMKDEG